MSQLGALLLIFVMVGTWLTHIIVCIKTSSWLFLIAGALFFPIAWIHGLGIWLGFW